MRSPDLVRLLLTVAAGRAENASPAGETNAYCRRAMKIARFLRPALVLSVICIAGAATATWADQESLWTYNDSVMYLVNKGL